MSFIQKTREMMICAGKEPADIAQITGDKSVNVRNNLSRGVSKIDKFLQLCEICGFSVVLENEDGVRIEVSQKDLDED